MANPSSTAAAPKESSCSGPTADNATYSAATGVKESTNPGVKGAQDECCNDGLQEMDGSSCQDECECRGAGQHETTDLGCDDAKMGCCGGSQCEDVSSDCSGGKSRCCNTETVESEYGDDDQGCCGSGQCEVVDLDCEEEEEECGRCDAGQEEVADLGCDDAGKGCCGGSQCEVVDSGCDDEKPGCCDAEQKPADLACKNDGQGCCSGGQYGVDDSSCKNEEECGCCNAVQDENPECDKDKKRCCSDAKYETKNSGCGDETENVDDGSACMCCLNALINDPQSFLLSPQEIVDSLTNVTVTYLEAQIGTLRACCKVLEKYCSGRSCCFVGSPILTSSLPTAPLPKLPNGPSRRTPRRFAIGEIPAGADSTGRDIGGGETLRLEIRGMDCASCMPKVARALSQLPSVTPTNLDYYGGTAELRYDPETIAPVAIMTYVARATGFGIKALSGNLGGGGSTIVTLPLLFSTIPPPTAFDGFETRVGSNPRLVEVSFPVHIDGPHRPREVLERFKPLGAELVAAGSDNNRDMATHDLISVSLRTIACATLSIPVLVLAWADLPPRPVLYGAISVGFTTLIQIVAFPIVSSACRSILYLRQADMSVLVAISTLTAYVFSVVSYAFEVAGRPFASAFFETSALLVTLIFLGRTISAATRRSTGSVLHELQRLQPTEVLLLTDEKSPPQSIDSRLLYYGDIIRITPETRIATDGLVVAGSSDADESSVTGESVAVAKRPGSRLIAGTLNLGGTLDVQVTQLTYENSLSRITALVRQAQSSRSPIQDLSDRLAAVVLPVATASACLAFVVWVLVGLYGRHQTATSSSVNALTYAIAILVISCPCAIGLAVPMVISVAIRIGIREGVLFRSADVLESAHRIDVVAFDKTGTLTQGDFTAERVEILVEGAEWVVYVLVKDNKHPISQGVHRYLTAHLAAKTQPSEGTLTDIVSLPGKGIKASLGGFPVLGGSADFTGVCTPLSSELRSSGLTVFTVTLAGQPIALFGLADTPRQDVHALVAELTRRGKEVIILSGDTPAAVHHLANAIGVPTDRTYAACSPEDKDTTIAALQASGKKVCFVGDGTNDGPALSRADIALAIGGGSDVALTAAGAVLLGSDLRRGVLALLDVAKAARMHTRLALVWCMVYNVFAILLASGVLVKVRIEPRWAGIGEVVSILPIFVIGFGLDVRWRWR